MSEKKFSIKIVSDTSREKVFAEIYYKNEEWAEISQEEEKPLIAFFPPLSGKYWEFPLAEALGAIQEAKKSLLEE
jgi:hypothetical protein